MRKIMQAVARALAALASFVWTLIKAGNRFVWSLIQRPPSQMDSAAMADAVVDDAEDADIVVPSTQPADELDAIRRFARALDEDTLGYSVMQSLGDLEIDWITAMSPQMRKVVRGASDRQLAEHLKGRGDLHELLRFERETIAEYRAAVLAAPQPKPERPYLRDAWQKP